MERIAQSISKRVVFRAYLASDGKTLATGKTIAVTISKNGGAFGNPAAGATNATEISSGFYYFDLGTGDTGTQGPLAWRGAEGTIDDAGDVYNVVNATNAGFTALPNAAADAAGGVPISDAGGLDLDAKLAATNEVTAARMGALTDWIDGGRLDLILDARSSQTSVDDLPTNAELATALAAADDAVLAAIAALNNLSQANIRTAVGLGSANLDTQLADLPTNAELATALGTADDAVLAAIAALNNLSQANIRTALGMGSANLDTQLGLLATAANLAVVAGYLDTEIAAIKAKTDNLPADPADQSAVEAAILAAWTTALTEAYATDGAAPTPAQALFLIMQSLHEFSISGTTRTVKRLDGSTTAATFTLNDATNPTSTTRAS